MWYVGPDEVAEARYNYTKLLRAYGCQDNLDDWSIGKLQEHLYEHQFDAGSGEWPEDP